MASAREGLAVGRLSERAHWVRGEDWGRNGVQDVQGDEHGSSRWPSWRRLRPGLGGLAPAPATLTRLLQWPSPPSGLPISSLVP